MVRVLLAAIERQGDSPWLHTTRGTVSYSLAWRRIAGLSEWLQHTVGVPRGGVVATTLSEPEWLVYLIWAGMVARSTVAFLPERCGPDHLEDLLREISAVAVIHHPQQPCSASGAIPFPADDLGRWSMEVQPGASGLAQDVSESGSGLLLQTSGTLGEAKWVRVSEWQIARAIRAMEDAGMLGHVANQVVYLSLPLSHSYGQSVLFESTFVQGAVVLPENPTLIGHLAALQHESLSQSITALEGVPFFHLQLARLAPRLRLPRLRHLGVGGGKLDIVVFERLSETLKPLSVSVRYGLTETPSVVSRKVLLSLQADDWTSSGRPLDIYKVRIENREGGECATNEVGEIRVRGPCVCLPYCGWQETAGASLATGDLGYLDDGGELHITGRKSLFADRWGFRVSLEYIEDALRRHPDVLDCRVVEEQTRLCAELVLRHRQALSTQVRQFGATVLPWYALPDMYTCVNSIDRTQSGKIRRIH